MQIEANNSTMARHSNVKRWTKVCISVLHCVGNYYVQQTNHKTILTQRYAGRAAPAITVLANITSHDLRQLCKCL